MLAIYRELKNDQTQTLELEGHLASCDACKQLLAQQSLVGERLRSLPTIEPLAGAQTKLMQALVHEHLNFLQRSPSPGTSTPPPAFLAPYLQQQSHNAAHTDPFIAFSTADTGPLPIIRVPRKRRPSRQMSHVAILGMAAAFLMVLLIGSLTSLLLVANRGIPGSGNSASVATFAEIAMARYTATTPFSHAVSAAATKNAIYYSAYGDGQTGWMLERLDTRTKISTPLLSASSVSPLIILGSSDEWLAWLQLDAATTIADKHVGSTTTTIAPRSWVLRVLSLSSDQATTAVPVTIAHDIFNQATVPQWVHTPIQGIRFVPDGLLVALIDGKGSAHLINYQLTPDNVEDEQQLATVNNGHIITSPASNSDSSSIYWSEEWLGDNGTLHSNIWTQQTVTMLPPHQGRWVPHAIVNKYLFRADGMSFHPQVVNDMLFLLSTNPANSANAGLALPDITPTIDPTVSPTSTTVLNPSMIARVSFLSYPSQIDEAVQGTLLTFTSDGTTTLPNPQNADGPISVLQGGNRFLLWQSPSKGVEMYDVVARSSVSIGTGTVPANANFLAVNGDTAIWTVNPNNASNQTSTTSSTVTFSTFRWPITRDSASA